MQVEVGGGLAAFDVLAPAVNVFAERVRKAEMVEMSADPARRAGRRHRFWKIGRKRPDEVDRAGNGSDPLLERANALRLHSIMELGRKLLANPSLDGVDKVLAAQSGIVPDRVGD